MPLYLILSLCKGSLERDEVELKVRVVAALQLHVRKFRNSLRGRGGVRMERGMIWKRRGEERGEEEKRGGERGEKRRDEERKREGRRREENRRERREEKRRERREEKREKRKEENRKRAKEKRLKRHR